MNVTFVATYMELPSEDDLKALFKLARSVGTESLMIKVDTIFSEEDED